MNPALVALHGQDPGRAVGRVDAEDQHGALVAGLHGGEGAVVVPTGGGHVLEGLDVPLHLGPCAVESDDPQRDLGVGGPRHRIAHGPRRLRGLGRVRDVPPLDRGAVHPCHQQPGAIRCPPVAAVAAHGFGGDVLGEAEADIRSAGFGDCAVRRPVRLGHPQRAAADVADPLSRRIGPRVDHRPRRGQPPREPAGDLHRPQIARQREDRQPGGLVGGVGDDAGALIAGPLPSGPFRLGQAVGGPARQAVRVGEQPLSAIANVKRPQAGDRVIPRPAAEEQHGAAVRGDGETVRCPEAEAAGPGQLAGERRRGHAHTVPHGGCK